MRRYWVEPSQFSKSEVKIEGDDFHHICEVCRQTVGDQFEVINGDGNAHLVEIKSMGRKEANCQLIKKRRLPVLKTPHVHLAISIPKFSTLEMILEKAVELGVKQVTPFVSDFSHVKNSDFEKWVGKIGRWQKIIKSATQQCGRSEQMQLNSVSNFRDLLESFNRTRDVVGLFPYEGEAPQGIRAAIKTALASNAKEVWVFIGSEGGFSRDEVKEFKKNGITPCTLGEQVLRVETACIVVIGILTYEIE